MNEYSNTLQIPLLKLPPEVTEDKIAEVVTSVVLRAALSATTPWPKWILLAALELLHGRRPATLDASTLAYLTQQTDHSAATTTIINTNNVVHNDSITEHNNDEDEELHIIRNSGMNSSTSINDDELCKDQHSPYSRGSCDDTSDSMHDPNSAAVCKTESRKPHYSQLPHCLAPHTLQTPGCDDYGCGASNRVAIGGLKNMLSSCAVYSNTYRESVNADHSENSDRMLINASADITAPTKVIQLIKNRQCSVRLTKDEELDAKVLEESIKTFHQTFGISNDMVGIIQDVEHDISDQLTENANRQTMPALDPHLTMTDTAAGLLQDSEHAQDITADSSDHNLNKTMQDISLKCDMGAIIDSTNEADATGSVQAAESFAHLSMRKLSCEDSHDVSMGTICCTHTTDVPNIESDARLKSNYFTEEQLEKKSNIQNLANRNGDLNSQSELGDILFCERCSTRVIKRASHGMKVDKATQVECESKEAQVQAKVKMCTKWIQVRKKKFVDKKVQCSEATDDNNIVQTAPNTTDASSVTLLQDIHKALDYKSEPPVMESREVQTLPVHSASVAVQVNNPKKKHKWRLVPLSGVPERTPSLNEVTTAPDAGSGPPSVQLFHGRPLNRKMEKITALIPLHAVEGLGGSIADPRKQL